MSYTRTLQWVRTVTVRKTKYGTSGKATIDSQALCLGGMPALQRCHVQLVHFDVWPIELHTADSVADVGLPPHRHCPAETVASRHPPSTLSCYKSVGTGSTLKRYSE